MATVTTDSTTMYVRLSRSEKIAGLLRDIAVPLDSVQEVAVEPDGLKAANRVRAPGLAIPGLRKIGIWRGGSGRMAVCVRRDQPALHLTLHGHKYSELLIGVANADQVASQLREGARNN